MADVPLGLAGPRRTICTLATLASCALLAIPLSINPAVAAAPNFIEFESGQVRPLAISPDGSTLFAVNTPNGTLEVFSIGTGTLTQTAHIPVGMEPVAVAARTNNEVWVVNHLSDSISVVSLSGTPHVVRTLLVGDEPRDIVFAGSKGLAFITTAHRGQQRTDPSIANVSGAGDPQLITPGVPRADVWVFDPNNLGTTMGGTPVQILSFFTDTPRGLAVSPDGNTVYVAGFETGNLTSVVNQGRVCDGFNANQPCKQPDGTFSPGGDLGPAADTSGEQAPKVAEMIQFKNGHWVDAAGRVWDNSVRFSLPDTDVFAVDANKLTQTAAFAGVGTTLYNMTTNPVNGHLYVSNGASQNQVRFEDPTRAGGSTVTGHLAEADITVISGSTVTPIHLNKHINYSLLPGDSGFDPNQQQHSLGIPLGMAVSSDGSTLYVAAFGSSKIGVFSTTALENNSFDPTVISANYITVSGGGPTGVILDQARNQLYTLTRFDDAVKVVNLGSHAEVAAVPLKNPEPASVVNGRPMLYDSRQFGSNGEAACASCHTFGDKDELAWDLGNPAGKVTSNPIPVNLGNAQEIALGKILFGENTPLNGTGNTNVFHPMKGPMTTQTLRGLTNSGAMHWRGDRANGFFGVNATDENLSFNNFIVAFKSLIGTVNQPTQAQMQAFTDFQLQVQLPPNPVRNLDNSLTASQTRGEAFFSGPRPADGINLSGTGLQLGQTAFTCNGCHELDPAEGQFGTSTNASFEGIDQIFKIPHLRNMYTKVGMFGMPATPFFNNRDTGNLGSQIRGFGFTNEGSIDTIFTFFHALVFNPTPNSGFPLVNTDGTRRDVEQYVLAFDSDLAPIVGQQVTLNNTNAAGAGPRVTLLEQRCGTAFTSLVLGGSTTECDLVANVVQGNSAQGLLFNPASGTIATASGSTLTDAQVRALAATVGQEVTFTAVPPGSGSRVAFSQ
jgi:YVTN family beta-propeller protein